MKTKNDMKEELEKYMCGTKNTNGFLTIFCLPNNYNFIYLILIKHGCHITKTEFHNQFRYVMTDISYSIMGEETLPFF